jgi:ubiquinone/menaquinone biosynthesis C-methylase UbiE
MKTQYDDIAKKYNNHMKMQKKKEVEDVLMLSGLTKKKIRIFELGCGTGLDAQYLLKKYNNIKEYLGIDNSNEMLKLFKKTVSDRRAKVIKADLDEYNIQFEHFDCVFGMYSVHYTRNIHKLMKMVYRGLKKDGIFLFRDTHPLVGFFRKKSKLYHKKEVVQFPISGGGKIYVTHPTFTLDEYINAISKAGYKIIRFVEDMGTQSKAQAVEGYEIPGRVFFILQKK